MTHSACAKGPGLQQLVIALVEDRVQVVAKIVLPEAPEHLRFVASLQGHHLSLSLYLHVHAIRHGQLLESVHAADTHHLPLLRGRQGDGVSLGLGLRFLSHCLRRCRLTAWAGTVLGGFGLFLLQIGRPRFFGPATPAGAAGGTATTGSATGSAAGGSAGSSRRGSVSSGACSIAHPTFILYARSFFWVEENSEGHRSAPGIDFVAIDVRESKIGSSELPSASKVGGPSLQREGKSVVPFQMKRVGFG